MAQSEAYSELLIKQGIPQSLHIFANGGHGLSLAQDIEGTNQWPDLFIDWLGKMDMINQ